MNCRPKVVIRAILEPLAIVISPYAPHIAEELWSLLGNTGSIATVPFPFLKLNI
jgi:leucyl-tRNA synthetase